MDFGPILVVVVLVIGVILMLMIKRTGGQTKKKTAGRNGAMYMSLNRQQFAAQWQRIEGLMAQPGTEQTKSAIFEADKLLDTALRQSGFPGETMGERLKAARQHFGNNAVYQGLWDAHKMRNALAHELSFELPKAVAQQHLNQFKAGLQYLRML